MQTHLFFYLFFEYVQSFFLIDNVDDECECQTFSLRVLPDVFWIFCQFQSGVLVKVLPGSIFSKVKQLNK